MMDNKDNRPEYEGTNREVAWYLLRGLRKQGINCEMMLSIGNIVSIQYKHKEKGTTFNLEVMCFHHDGRVPVDEIINNHLSSEAQIMGLAADAEFTEQAKYYADENNILLIDKDDLEYLRTQAGGIATAIKIENFVHYWSNGKCCISKKDQ